MHRFFVPQDQIPTIIGSDAHQIKNVLRLKVGDQIELLDGTGKIHTSKITKMEQNKIACNVLSTKHDETEPKIKVTLAQCLPKAKKMALIIQKCTELGIRQIIPTLSERSIAKGEKLDRWKKIAKEAAEQSGRSTIPEIAPLTKFADILKLKSQFDIALIPWELEKEITLKQILSTQPPNHLLVLIGPEGGFSQEEIKLAQEAGFTPVSLGKRILRTETASMAILAMIMYAFE